MRVSELSRAAGLPPATVKWYLRIGLLHKGTPTAANQADYDATHLRRLRLIRALLEVGGMSVDAARQILDAVDQADLSMVELMAVAHRALSTGTPKRDRPEDTASVDAFLARRGWDVRPDSSARRDLAAVVGALREVGTDSAPDVGTTAAVERLLEPYADAAETIAALEVRGGRPDLTREQLVERVVVGGVLMERALAALRRLAQEHHARLQFASPATKTPPSRRARRSPAPPSRRGDRS